MAITTVDGIIGGFKTTQNINKSLPADGTNGTLNSAFYSSGVPTAAVAPTPGISGAALTSYSGQIPFVNPSAGLNSYLARFALSTGQSSSYGNIILCDRLWHNSGITINSGSIQNINSVAFPARDNNGTTDGAGVLVGLEFSSAGGANSPTITISYTNSAGVSGRTATNLMPTQASPPIGRFYPMRLQDEDIGVRSIQTLAFGGTGWASGTAHLVAYRVLQSIRQFGNHTTADNPVLTTGMVRLYNNTVPFLITQMNQGSAGWGVMTVTQG
jgi:hypothetical protein